MKRKRRAGDGENEAGDPDESEWGDFAFIAGFTEAGFPFGVTKQEMQELQAEQERWIQARKERPMRTLSVDMNDLEMAFESRSEVYNYYLDMETGRIVTVPGYGSDIDETDEMAEAMELIDSAPVERFLALDSDADLRPSIGEALEFVERVEDETLRRRLAGALGQRRRAFRQFLDIVYSEAGEAERWNHFRRQCFRKHIAEYLQSEGVSIVCEPLPPFVRTTGRASTFLPRRTRSSRASAGSRG